MWGLEKGMYSAVALFVFCTFFLSLFLFGGTFKMWEVESFVGEITSNVRCFGDPLSISFPQMSDFGKYYAFVQVSSFLLLTMGRDFNECDTNSNVWPWTCGDKFV